MTREETTKAAETMLAHAEGKEIEILVYDYNGRKEWGDCKNPDWNWDSHDYRIKPEEPKLMPVTEEELEKMKVFWMKSKETAAICLTRFPKSYVNGYFIYNPETKCWEDWEDTYEKAKLRHHYNGGQP